MKIRNIINKIWHIKLPTRKFNLEGSVKISPKLKGLNEDIYEQLTALKPEIAQKAHANGLKLKFKPDKKDLQKVRIIGELENAGDTDVEHFAVGEINSNEQPQLSLMDKIKLQIAGFVKELNVKL